MQKIFFPLDIPYLFNYSKEMSKVQSKITSKFQITIPKEVRELLKLEEADVIEWQIDQDGIHIESASKPFLKYHGFFKKESGSVKKDIEKAWKIRAKRYK